MNLQTAGSFNTVNHGKEGEISGVFVVFLFCFVLSLSCWFSGEDFL